MSRPMHRDQIQVVVSPGSSTTPKRREESTSSSGTPETDVDVRHRTVNSQPEYYHETWHSEGQRGRAAPQVDSSRTNHGSGHRRNLSNRSTDGTLSPVPKRFSTKMENGEHSPLLTGKDAAYSSVSGASVASPINVPARSPQAQFGLFPSSARTTPKGSVSGRHGAMSPAFGPLHGSTQSSAAPSRPETAISTFSDASSKRLSKRSSFTSLKRLFTRKRSEDINSIPE
jgi:hypothetical protein